MKTKNIIKKGLLLISVATFASCSSFLEEENWTSQSAEDYYKTAKGYESLVNGAYASLKSVYNNYSTINLLNWVLILAHSLTVLLLAT